MAEIAKQHWSAKRYARTAHFVPALGAPVLELLAPRPGERILDLGCGDGVLTEKIVAAGATVVAVDAGTDMVAAARARDLDARVMDGQKLTFEAEFDAVFSNAALHWMRDQEAVLAGVHRALKPAGRFVAEASMPAGSIPGTSRRPMRTAGNWKRHGLPSRKSRSCRARRSCRPVLKPGSTPSPRISLARCPLRSEEAPAPKWPNSYGLS